VLCNFEKHYLINLRFIIPPLQIFDSSYRKMEAGTLKIGSFTVLKIEGSIQPKETDTVTIQCHPDFLGAQEEEIMILVSDAAPEDREKFLKLLVDGYMPSIDLQDLDAMFLESHIVDHIEDFVHPKDVSTSFADRACYLSILIN